MLKPEHQRITRAFRFAMDVKPAASAKLFSALETCWTLRNDLSELMQHDRRFNRELRALAEMATEAGGTEDETLEKIEYLTQNKLFAIVKDLAKDNPDLAAIHSQVRQNVAKRIVDGTKTWLAAIGKGNKKVKPPQWKALKNYRSFCYPQYGSACSISRGKVHLSGFGWFKLFDHRRIIGVPKTITIKHMQGRWWCIVTAESFEADWFGIDPTSFETRIAEDARPDAGGDPGLASLMSDSHGHVYDPPRALKNALYRLKLEGRDMARKFRAREAAHTCLVEQARSGGGDAPTLRSMPYSNRLKKQIRVVARTHTKVTRVREYHHRKIASILDARYRRFACEEHGVKFMLANRRTARAAADRAIHALKERIEATLGRRYFPVPNHREGIGGNSQTCLCAAPVPKELEDRFHVCQACGLGTTPEPASRDHVSSNIAQVIAFGTISDSLYSKYPAGRQPVVIRGGSEGCAGESPASGPSVPTTAESPKKRKSSASRSSTTGGKPTMAGKTAVNRCRQPTEALPAEPQASKPKRATARRKPGGSKETDR